MKHHSDQSEHLQRLARELGIGLAPEVAELCAEHVRLMLEANQRLNLTTIVDESDALRLHAIDSIAALPEVLEAPEGAILDIGTGGGFPGLPLCIVSGRKGVLLDSVSKKADAVKSMVAALGQGRRVEVLASRVEELPGRRFAVVLARAVSGLPSLVELAAPQLARRGVLVALKGPVGAEELQKGDAAAALVGMKRHGVRRYVLPEGEEQRSVVSYIKVGEPAIKLPRRSGLAQKRPFA